MAAAVPSQVRASAAAATRRSLTIDASHQNLFLWRINADMVPAHEASSNGLTGLGYAGALARRFAVNQKIVLMEEASIARRPACRPGRTGIGDARDSGGALIVSFRRKMTLSQDAASRPP
ncbi:hypothetical protein MesoLj113b_72000 (plasmid) [Mesorhizobium sp. 113-3-3]|nr:hypothetical protein MesoLj113b_72000 [Mesorhizobium sp. 113-3-3]